MSSLLFLGHSASRSGAPLLLLHMLRWMRQHSRNEIALTLANGGPLESDFREVVPTTVLSHVGPAKMQGVRAVGRIPWLGPKVKGIWYRTLHACGGGARPDLVYVNTVASATLLGRLGLHSIPVIAHIHELEYGIAQNGGAEAMRLLRERTDLFISASGAVTRSLIANHGIAPERTTTIPSFIHLPPLDRSAAARASTRARLGIPEHAFVVGGCGAVDQRKGTDLFVRVAKHLLETCPAVPWWFLWIGADGRDAEFARKVHEAVAGSGCHNRFTFTGAVVNARELFVAMDAFCLPSREDALGLVGVEAASLAIPVVCFAGAGGMPELTADGCGFAVSYLDTAAMAEAIGALARDPAMCQRIGAAAAAKARREYDLTVGAARVLSCIESVLEAAAAGRSVAIGA